MDLTSLWAFLTDIPIPRRLEDPRYLASLFFEKLVLRERRVGREVAF